MIIRDISIVTSTKIIEKGYLTFEDGLIKNIGEGDYLGNEESISKPGLIAFPGFIDIHIHGSVGIDFMDAKEEDYSKIADSLYEEGVTTFLATTLTSDKESLARVCKTVKIPEFLFFSCPSENLWTGRCKKIFDLRFIREYHV